MTMEDLKNRLKVLLDQDVIAQKEYDVTIASFERLQNTLGKREVEQAEMLFTHLPMALTRIEKGEKVENPDETIMNEVANSANFPMAKAHVSFIEEKWGKSLPEGEREFLYMHYTNVINLNLGGE